MRSGTPSRRAFLRSGSACSLVCALALAATASQVQASRLDDQSAVIEGLRRYCTTSWQTAGMPQANWEDSTQEVYLRLLQNVDQGRWRIALEDLQSKEHRELIRAVRTVTKRYQRSRRHRSLEGLLPVLATPDQAHRSWDEPELLQQALQQRLNRITCTQLQILQLWCQGHKSADIGRVLGLTPERVSDQKYKALGKLRRTVGIA